MLCSVVAVLAAASNQAPQAPPGEPRTIVVVSDLHMGIGLRSATEWHPFEDFRWSPEFAAFLDAAGRDGRNAVDLVLNGDTFELLQSNDGACVDAAGLGCSAEDAAARLDRVLAAHKAEIGALSAFARAGSNRVVFVPGDHDAALLFPAVRRRVLDAVAAPSGRVDVASSGFWVSRDGRIFAEHGHQIPPSVDALENWPAPFVRRGAREHLVRSEGEAVVQDLVNRIEERYPVVDNLAAAGVGLKYALAAGGADPVEHAPRLIRAVLLSTPWQQFRMELDDGEVVPPVWDIAQVRSQGAAFFVSSLPDDDPLKPGVAGAAANGTLTSLLAKWTDEEIGAVCDYRAAVRRARRRFEPPVTQFAPRGPALAECPRTPETRGALFDYFWRSRDEKFGRLLASRRAIAGGPAPAVLVHGHTHLPDRSQTGAISISGGLPKIPTEGFSPVRGATTPVVINGGAWQRTLTPVQYERMRADRSLSDDALLRQLKPEDLAPCYGFVRIPPYTDLPAPAVRYWRRAGGEWGMAGGCGQ